MRFFSHTSHPTYVNRSLFSSWERKMDAVVLRSIPSWLKTYHLTLATILWSILALVSGWFFAAHHAWIFGIACAIVLHYMTDHFDGAVGRLQQTGLVAWGYYMDHLLDFLFLCAVFIGYLFAFPFAGPWIVALLSVSGAFMVQSFLVSLITGDFVISHARIGPAEFSAILCVVTIASFFASPSVISYLFIGMFLIALVGFIVVAYRLQRMLWERDMAYKEGRPPSE